MAKGVQPELCHLAIFHSPIMGIVDLGNGPRCAGVARENEWGKVEKYVREQRAAFAELKSPSSRSLSEIRKLETVTHSESTTYVIA